MNESIYMQLIRGLQLSAIVQSVILDLNGQSIFGVLNFFFEKVIFFSL